MNNQKSFTLADSLKRWGWTILLTLFLWQTLVFLNQGILAWPNRESIIELTFAFLFLESLYWSHLYIIRKVIPRTDKWHFTIRTLLEFILVITTGLFCVFIINYLPLLWIYGGGNITEPNVRAAFVIAPIVSLLLYYFVERMKSRERLQQERVRTSTLEKENYKAQLQALKSQMSPHFLFNSLNVLSLLITNDAEKALEYTYRLSDLYRIYLQSTHHETISLKEEMIMIEAYRYLLETRFADQIQFHVDTQTTVAHELHVPPGAIQECIDNVVKHNGSTKVKPLIISIKLLDSFICIENNRSPRREAITSTKTGWQNILQRYRLLTSALPYVEESKESYRVYLPLLNLTTT